MPFSGVCGGVGGWAAVGVGSGGGAPIPGSENFEKSNLLTSKFENPEQ